MTLYLVSREQCVTCASCVFADFSVFICIVCYISVYRVLRFNNLPSDIDDFSTLCSFKRTVKIVDLSPVLKCFSLGHIVVYCFTSCFAWVCVYVWTFVSAGYPVLLFQLIVLCTSINQSINRGFILRVNAKPLMRCV